jgi:hypothetical protein
MQAKSDLLLLRLPYELKDTFRTLFKSARWDGLAKAFVCKDTAANRNKWEKFCQAASSARGVLDAAEREEATAQQLQAMAMSLEDEMRGLNARAAAARARCAELAARKARLEAECPALIAIKQQAEQALEAQQLALDTAMRTYEHAAAPALEVLERHRFSDVLNDMLRATRRGYSGKEWLGELQATTAVVRKQLAEIGYEHRRITEISRLSLNRPDRFQALVPLCQASLPGGFVPASPAVPS